MLTNRPVSLVPVDMYPLSYSLSSYIESYLCRKCIGSYFVWMLHSFLALCWSHFSRLCPSQESLSAIKVSSRTSALNIDLLSGICQRSTANKPFGGHLPLPPNMFFFLQRFVIRKYVYVLSATQLHSDTGDS